jgi:DNA-binding NarL/FixJ family response regulator
MENPGHEPVLLLEDQALIAIYMEELLHEAGFDNISTLSSCAAAAEWLQKNTPGLAVIETRLRDEPCDAIAAVLNQRRSIYRPLGRTGRQWKSPVHGHEMQVDRQTLRSG